MSEPHDHEAERQLLGAVVVRGQAPVRAAADAGLVAGDFYRPSHGVIWQMATEMAADSRPIDSITLVNALGDCDLLEQAGGANAVRALGNDVIAGAGAEHYAGIIREKALKRERLRLFRDAVRHESNGGNPPEQIAWLADRIRELGVKSGLASVDGHLGASRIERWDEFRDATPAGVAFLVKPLIPVGSIGFQGAGKGAGKTWLALTLAVAVATGKPFLGRFPIPEPRDVVYVALEGQRANLRDRIGAIARGMGIDPDCDELNRLHMLYKPHPIDLRDPGITALMVRDVLDRRPALVVIDVLRSAAKVSESNEGASDFAEVMGNLRPLVEADCAVMVAHHFTKPNDATSKRQAGDRMSGSGALFGHADFGLFITAYDRDARTMTLESYVRDGAEVPELTVRLVGDGSGQYGALRYADQLSVTAEADTDAEETRQEHHSTAIVRNLGHRPGATKNQLVAAVGGNATAAARSITNLVAAGQITTRPGPRNATLHYLLKDAPRLVPGLAEPVGTGGLSGTDSTGSTPVGGTGGQGTGSNDDVRNPE